MSFAGTVILPSFLTSAGIEKLIAISRFVAEKNSLVFEAFRRILFNTGRVVEEFTAKLTISSAWWRSFCEQETFINFICIILKPPSKTIKNINIYTFVYV